MTRVPFLLALALVAASSLDAQRVAARFEASTAAPQVSARPRKNPTLAALLSWLVFPGVGSYYAGNSGHGTRHVLIAVGTAGPAIALFATCDSDGFCDFDHDALRLSATIALAAGYVANEAWSIITAVDDAERANETAANGRLSLALAVLAMRSPLSVTDGPRVGVRLVRVAF